MYVHMGGRLRGYPALIAVGRANLSDLAPMEWVEVVRKATILTPLFQKRLPQQWVHAKHLLWSEVPNDGASKS
jgi:hypothetical protein